MGIGTIDRLPRLTLFLGRIGMPTVPLSISIRVNIDLYIYIEKVNFLVDRSFVFKSFYVVKKSLYILN